MTTPLTPETIARLRELEAKATAGEWRHGFDDGSGTACEDAGGWLLRKSSNPDNPDQYTTVVSGGRDSWGVREGVRRVEDADFIAAARNALPALLDEVERLRAALLEAAEDVDDWGGYAPGYLQNKHDLPGAVARYRAIAEGKPDPGREVTKASNP